MQVLFVIRPTIRNVLFASLVYGIITSNQTAKGGAAVLFSLFWLIWPLLYATGALGMGVAAFGNNITVLSALTFLAGCVLPLRGIWYIVLARRGGTPLRARMLIQTVLEILLVPVIIFLPQISYRSFAFFLLLYFSFHAAVQGINAVIYGRNRVTQYFIPALCQSALFSSLLIGLVLLPSDLCQRIVLDGSGLLLSLLGHTYLCDWMAVTVKNKRVAEIFRKISVTMPGFSGLGVPARLLDTLHNDAPAERPDAEVIFNYGKHGKGIAGHCELCVDGKTYTYGNYDPDSRSVFNTMGNGIVFRADKERYLAFLLSLDRTVVVYGLKFDVKQRRRFKRNLRRFNRSLTPWHQQVVHIAPNEYIHRVLSELDADVFRIQAGRFKTYFLPTINCVTFTGSLLRGTAAGNVVIPGVYAPGSYMEALHRLYVAGNDIVISVQRYNV